jgi:hypothetical protein
VTKNWRYCIKHQTQVLATATALAAVLLVRIRLWRQDPFPHFIPEDKMWVGETSCHDGTANIQEHETANGFKDEPNPSNDGRNLVVLSSSVDRNRVAKEADHEEAEGHTNHGAINAPHGRLYLVVVEVGGELASGKQRNTGDGQQAEANADGVDHEDRFSGVAATSARIEHKEKAVSDLTLGPHSMLEVLRRCRLRPTLDRNMMTSPCTYQHVWDRLGGASCWTYSSPLTTAMLGCVNSSLNVISPSVDCWWCWWGGSTTVTIAASSSPLTVMMRPPHFSQLAALANVQLEDEEIEIRLIMSRMFCYYHTVRSCSPALWFPHDVVVTA